MEFSYLAIGAIVTIAALGLAAALPAARWLVITSGLRATPAGLADAIFVPEYWNPRHVFGASLNIEGALFSLGNGGLIGALLWARRRHVLPAEAPSPEDFQAALRRLTALVLSGFGLFLLLWQGTLGPLPVMQAVLVALAAMAMALWGIGALPARLAVGMGAGFGAVSAAQAALWGALDPAFDRFWDDQAAYLARMPVPPFLPIEDFLWAAIYGAVWAGMLLLAFSRRPAR